MLSIHYAIRKVSFLSHVKATRQGDLSYSKKLTEAWALLSMSRKDIGDAYTEVIISTYLQLNFAGFLDMWNNSQCC